MAVPLSSFCSAADSCAERGAENTVSWVVSEAPLSIDATLAPAATVSCVEVSRARRGPVTSMALRNAYWLASGPTEMIVTGIW